MEKTTAEETSVGVTSANASSQTKMDDAIISVDDEDTGDLDEVLAMNVGPNTTPVRKSKENEPINQLGIKQTEMNVSKPPECVPPSPHINTQKNAETGHSTPMVANNQNDKITSTAKTIANVKRKRKRPLSPKFHRIQRVEYLSDSDDDSQSAAPNQIQAQEANEVQNEDQDNVETASKDEIEDSLQSNSNMDSASDSDDSDFCLVFPD